MSIQAINTNYQKIGRLLEVVLAKANLEYPALDITCDNGTDPNHGTSEALLENLAKLRQNKYYAIRTSGIYPHKELKLVLQELPERNTIL